MLPWKGSSVGAVPAAGQINCSAQFPGAPGSSVVQIFYKRCSMLNQQRHKRNGRCSVKEGHHTSYEF